MYAIIEDSGTQISVRRDDVVDIDLRDLEPGATQITFNRVLLLGDTAGGEAVVGTPYVEGAAVTAEIVAHVWGEKIDVKRFRRRWGYNRKRGHRQGYLRVRIDEITSPPSSKLAARIGRTKHLPAAEE